MTVVELKRIVITAGGSGNSDDNNSAGNAAPVCVSNAVTFMAVMTNVDIGGEGVEWYVQEPGGGGWQPQGAGKESTLTFPQTGTYEVKAECGSKSVVIFVVVLKVDVEQSEMNVCAETTNATLNLTADSYLGSGTANWESEPGGIAGSGINIAFDPSSLTPTTYVVTARSSLLTNCYDTCTVSALKVDLTGFTKTNVWPLHADVITNFHQTTCQATIEPTGVSTITYSIQGATHGATINSTNGVITPGYEQSGQITVRAAATVLPSCYDETNLTIHAIPVDWVSSVVVSAYTSGVYGAGWIHTFSSSGGSLTNVYIAEAVSNQPPNPFGYNYDVPAPPPVYGNQWELTDGGTMTEADYYQTDVSVIDATQFTNFSQTATDHQWYYWNCENCSGWQQFTGPHSISVILSTNGVGGFEVRTEAYGQTHTDPYVGP